ncbi:MAG: hypothetical protein A2086_16345 [Spirochaetes bacterium GWD1_27_9]|nr:MAG: hypothetical protein A2Y34_18115 [Spirochaetes bacterium GWC1_27_15]OHD35371.1 MAG: hypothetical protein A2086_16345 [Spirochaetes bacterium GWD1_27_9]
MIMNILKYLLSYFWVIKNLIIWYGIMRYIKNLMFFIFIVLIFISLWINIIIVNSQRTTKIDILASLDGIYFDTALMDKANFDKIDKLINSNNSAVFSKLIESKNPISEFYGFVGFMKSNQKAGVKYLNNLLISTKKVNIYADGKKSESFLGYAILLLIKNFPEYLTNKPIDDFYSSTEKIIENSYKSQLIKNDEGYKNTITQLITEKYPSLSKTFALDVLNFDNLKSKTLEEKITLSTMLNSVPQDKREKILIDLLQERNDKITPNVLQVLNETDTANVANEVYQIILTTTSVDIVTNAVKKYSLILKTQSIPNIQTYMKPIINKDNLILVCLDQIYNYGTASSYEFLKLYLETNYSPQVNLMALKTIIQTTYKTYPTNVMKTFMFIIRYYDIEPVVVYTIRFFIQNSISESSDAVLSRLSKKESLEMKKVAIEYISHFNLKTGLPLIKELANDSDSNIKQKAMELAAKL